MAQWVVFHVVLVFCIFSVGTFVYTGAAYCHWLATFCVSVFSVMQWHPIQGLVLQLCALCCLD